MNFEKFGYTEYIVKRREKKRGKKHSERIRKTSYLETDRKI